MGASKKKQSKKPASPKKRRGSAPKTSRRVEPENLEIKGAEYPRVQRLEDLGREFDAAEADRKAAIATKEKTADSIDRALAKLPESYGGKYRTATGRLLEVTTKRKVVSRPTKKPTTKRRKPADPTPAALPN
jgi:hypothetical protein